MFRILLACLLILLALIGRSYCFSPRSLFASSIRPSFISRIAAGSVRTHGHCHEDSTLKRQYRWADFLYRYDQENLSTPHSYLKDKSINSISFDEALVNIDDFKSQLGEQAANVFGVLPDDRKLKSILGSLQQTFDNQYLYPSIIEEAANLFYLIIKNHPFVDGNKRIAVELCAQFIQKNNIAFQNNDIDAFCESLAILAIFVAQSIEKDKELIMMLIMEVMKMKLLINANKSVFEVSKRSNPF